MQKLKDSLLAIQKEYRISKRWVEHFLSLFEEIECNQDQKKMIEENLRKIILENEGDRDDIYSDVVDFIKEIR